MSSFQVWLLLCHNDRGHFARLMELLVLVKTHQIILFWSTCYVVILDSFLFFLLFTWSHPNLSEAHLGLGSFAVFFINLNSCVLTSFPVWLCVGSTVCCVKYETVAERHQLARRRMSSERGGTWVGICLWVVTSLEITFWYDDLYFATKPFNCRNRDHEDPTPVFHHYINCIGKLKLKSNYILISLKAWSKAWVRN